MGNNRRNIDISGDPISTLELRNFERDAEGLLPIDLARLAWEYTSSPDAHILRAFSRQAIDDLKTLPRLERIQAAASLAINAIHILAMERYEQQMASIDREFDEATTRIRDKVDEIIQPHGDTPER